MHTFNSDKKSYTEDGKLTLKGILELDFDDYFKMITDEREFAQSTRDRYAASYIIILQYTSDNKAAEDYTKSDYQVIIEQLRNRQINGHRIDEVSINTNYRHLVYDLAIMVIEHYKIKNRLEDEIFYKVHSRKRKNNSVIIKSFTIKDLITIINIIKSNIEIEGLYMGISLMLFFGVRNNEAVSLKFKDIIKLDNYDAFNIRINESGTGKAGESKPSTKTESGNRYVPFICWCLVMIRNRIEFIHNKTGLSYKEIGELPIVCKGNDFSKPCKSNDISQIALSMFKDKFEFTIEDFAAYYEEMEDDERLKEYTLSAYVFRRNFITYASLLMSEEELMLCAGHLIDGDKEIWEYTQDASYIYSIYKKINKPFLSDPHELFKDDTGFMNIETTSKLKLDVENTSNKDLRIKVRLNNREFDDPISIKSKGNTQTVIVDEGFDDKLPDKDVYLVNEFRRQFSESKTECIMKDSIYEETIEFMKRFCENQDNQDSDLFDD